MNVNAWSGVTGPTIAGMPLAVLMVGVQWMPAAAHTTASDRHPGLLTKGGGQGTIVPWPLRKATTGPARAGGCFECL
jgi:hypothetical protein